MVRHHERDIRAEIDSALADPILKDAMSRAMGTMLDRRAAAWPDSDRFEALREQARGIKEEALGRQEELLDMFERQAAAAGAIVHHASDAASAREYIRGLALERSVRTVVKAKSMTSEEIRLTPALEDAGITVIEGDLGERIIQLAGEHPSHLVVPAIHKSKEEIIRLLSEKMGIADPPADAEGLTRLVRQDLRDRFLNADMGITGANFAIAETGSIVLVENEGNASLATLLPSIHVAVIGREKLIPRLVDLSVFLELLPRNATGQKLTSYISMITGRQSSPLLGGRQVAGRRECHLVMLDNGRQAALSDPELREALRCIRCGACLNACAPYNLVGGHVYGSDPYPGGIGCAWTYITKGHAPAWDVNGLCTTCSRCTEVCPVDIDIPWLNTVIRERNNREFGTGLRQRIFSRTDLMGGALSTFGRMGQVAMKSPPAKMAFKGLGIDPSRRMPAYQHETLRSWWAQRPTRGESPSSAESASATGPAGPEEDRPPRVALFVDCFVNHNLPHVGKAAVQVLEELGIDVVLAQNECCGRGAMSQGLLEKPRAWAAHNLIEMGRLLEQGRDIVFIEPSCLSAIRDDYTRLLEAQSVDHALLGRIQDRSYDLTEYLVMLSDAGRLRIKPSPLKKDYVVHGHCHQKSLDIASYPARLLGLIPGVTLHEVQALCCGLVGSFGYKREYSELSKAIGARLFEQIDRYPGDVVACGISCRSQIEMGTDRRVLHPLEVLARALGL